MEASCSCYNTAPIDLTVDVSSVKTAMERKALCCPRCEDGAAPPGATRPGLRGRHCEDGAAPPVRRSPGVRATDKPGDGGRIRVFWSQGQINRRNRRFLTPRGQDQRPSLLCASEVQLFSVSLSVSVYFPPSFFLSFCFLCGNSFCLSVSLSVSSQSFSFFLLSPLTHSLSFSCSLSLCFPLFISLSHCLSLYLPPLFLSLPSLTHLLSLSLSFSLHPPSVTHRSRLQASRTSTSLQTARCVSLWPGSNSS